MEYIGKLLCKHIIVKYSKNEKRLKSVVQICSHSWIHIVNFFVELQLRDFPVLKNSDIEETLSNAQGLEAV